MDYFISDPHFFHENVIRFDKRPFTSVEEMNAKMRDWWNNTVSTKDRVYILGDFIWLPPSDPEYIKFTKSLNGNKVLIKGNHDNVEKFSSELKNCFEDIKSRKEIKLNKKRIIMDHYPLMMYRHDTDANVFHFHGHTHITHEQDWVEKWTRELVNNRTVGSPTGQIINVGCMMPYMNYIPRTFEEIIEAGKEKYEWLV
jgi:calcineurin-like phosphoesterase family protein